MLTWRITYLKSQIINCWRAALDFIGSIGELKNEPNPMKNVLRVLFRLNHLEILDRHPIATLETHLPIAPGILAQQWKEQYAEQEKGDIDAQSGGNSGKVIFLELIISMMATIRYGRIWIARWSSEKLINSSLILKSLTWADLGTCHAHWQCNVPNSFLFS